MPAALITGAARRIGASLALAAAKAGHDVAIHHHTSPEAAEDTAAAVRALGVRAAVLSGDLTETGIAERLIGEATAALGRLTLLVNNASLFENDRVGSITEASWDGHFAANVRAPVLLAQAFAAALPAGMEGLVVNIADQRVLRPNPQFFSYSASKAALLWVTKTLAQALAPAIRVNAIGPGPTLGSVHQAPGEFEAEAAGTPLGRPVDPTQIAAALTYLIDARSVTGQMIAVDAGQHLAWKTPDIVGE
jgi:NAD(P)-dependent dehydrogenase (short-subunit alcohol dehydrogenase family)